MPKGPMIGFAVAAAAGLACFLLLLFMPAGRLAQVPSGVPLITDNGADQAADRDVWMNASLRDKKIGYSHLVLKKKDNGFTLEETLSIRFTLLGASRPLKMKTTASLLPDMTLSTFDFVIYSGLFRFSAKGRAAGPRTLSVTTASGAASSGTGVTHEITLEKPPVLGSSMLFAVGAKKNLRIGDRFSFFIFDPATMGKAPVIVEVTGKEKLFNMGIDVDTTKLTIDFKGMKETAWIDDTGAVIKETGMMGLSLERTSRDDALVDVPPGAGPDMAQMASIPSNIVISDPAAARRLVVEISGIDTGRLALCGGRQAFVGNRLTVALEDTQNLPEIHKISDRNIFGPYLVPDPYVQSNNPKIVSLAKTLVDPKKSLYENSRALWKWVNENIAKRPVISVPDALSTLENRVGDCNEHAALVCALARAAGIPAKIETGLVYMRGRFYYHAWNSLYVGKWITADAALGQFPADVTHLRLITGSLENQLDYAGIIGRIRLSVKIVQ
ncbi:MAG: transglutaminase domain-containing protein [Deltaproteobacteria bacterium]|nr:transglutaminase domain-containing protein [Deltaproteobacteria bacterium]